MTIAIEEDGQTLTLSNEELDNANFVDLELCGESAKTQDNPRGWIAECTMPIGELKAAVDSFNALKNK